jgi:hypothetical protein
VVLPPVSHPRSRQLYSTVGRGAATVLQFDKCCTVLDSAWGKWMRGGGGGHTPGPETVGSFVTRHPHTHCAGPSDPDGGCETPEFGFDVFGVGTLVAGILCEIGVVVGWYSTVLQGCLYCPTLSPAARTWSICLGILILMF